MTDALTSYLQQRRIAPEQRAVSLPRLVKWTIRQRNGPKYQAVRIACESERLWVERNFGRHKCPYIPPRAAMDIWLEWWLPSGFLEDPNSGPATSAGMLIGHRAHRRRAKQRRYFRECGISPTVPAAPAFPFRPPPCPNQHRDPLTGEINFSPMIRESTLLVTQILGGIPSARTLQSDVRDPEDQGAAVPGFPHDDLRTIPSVSSTTRVPYCPGRAFRACDLHRGFEHHFGFRAQWQRG